MILAQTPWAYPTNISQITESDAHVAWDSAGFSYLRYEDASYLRTVKTLQHIPNSFAGDRGMKTWYILASGFNFQAVPQKITGILVELKTDRGGRITDDTVQLRTVSTWTGYTGAVGDNKANADLGQKKVYGSTVDLWGWDRIGYTGSLLDTVLQQAIITPNFGIALRFQSHPYWPHNSTPMIDYVKIKLIWDDGNTADDGPIPDDNGGGKPNTGASGPGPGPEGVGEGGNDGINGPGNGYGGSSGFVGSFNYAGSGGYTGSASYTGSGGNYTGSQGDGGYIPPPPL
jgi:hypothetical protein